MRNTKKKKAGVKQIPRNKRQINKHGSNISKDYINKRIRE